MRFPELCQNLTDKGGRLPGLPLGATIDFQQIKKRLHLYEVWVGPSGHPPSFPKKGEPWRGGCRTPS